MLGGARSGKSRYAERQATGSEKNVVYLATAEAGDDEMRARIQRHRADRPRSWRTVEEPVKLGSAIRQYAGDRTFVLIDCLTLWLSNVLFDSGGGLQPTVFQREKDDLLQALAECTGNVVLVSNEVGQGVVSVYETTRRFVDEAGRLHQEIAALSDRVVLVTAGLPLVLKPAV